MTTQNSTQYGYQISSPPTISEANVAYGKLRVIKVNFTQSGAGSAGSIARLYKLPAGKVTFLGGQSQVKTSAFGTGRTLDLGWAAYQDQAGAAVVADANGITSAQDVAAAAVWIPGNALADGTYTFTSRGGVILTATVNVSTIPADATIQGTFVIAVE